MNWNKFISKQHLDELSKKIKTVENETSAEIVTVIADKSSTTQHIKFTIFLLLCVLSFILFYSIDVSFYIHSDIPLLLITQALNIFIAIFLSKFLFIQRLLTPKSDRRLQVEAMAEREYYVQRINMTRSKTGLLIYVSLMEKQVVILADKSIAEKFPKNSWVEIIDIITKKAHNEGLYKGLNDGINECSLRLKKYFPIEANDSNELPNNIILRTLYNTLEISN